MDGQVERLLGTLINRIARGFRHISDIHSCCFTGRDSYEYSDNLSLRRAAFTTYPHKYRGMVWRRWGVFKFRIRSVFIAAQPR